MNAECEHGPLDHGPCALCAILADPMKAKQRMESAERELDLERAADAELRSKLNDAWAELDAAIGRNSVLRAEAEILKAALRGLREAVTSAAGDILRFVTDMRGKDHHSVKRLREAVEGAERALSATERKP